jgi:hypothetical protein
MFSISTKINPFETYNNISTQFQTIKSLNSFNTYTVIPTNDLISISNIIMEAVDKLSEISIFYIKKLNESISNNLLIQFQEMFKYHNCLLDKIFEFNKISADILDGMQNTFSLKLPPEIVNYINYDIINRYKLIIIQIINYIKKLNAYVSLVKDKL